MSVLAVLSMIATAPKNQGNEIGRKFENFEKHLKSKTQNPEDVAAMKDYMLTLPMKIHELRGEIDQTEVCACFPKTPKFMSHEHVRK